MNRAPRGTRWNKVLAALPLVSDKQTASALGLTCQGLIRVLTTLQREGLVQAEERRITDGRCGPRPRRWVRVTTTNP